MLRCIDPKPLPKRRVTIRFTYPELPGNHRDWWVVIEPTGEHDLCQVDPGHEVDVFVTASLRAMTSVWMGVTLLASECERGAIDVDGETGLVRSMQSWLGLSPFAKVARREHGLVGRAS